MAKDHVRKSAGARAKESLRSWWWLVSIGLLLLAYVLGGSGRSEEARLALDLRSALATEVVATDIPFWTPAVTAYVPATVLAPEKRSKGVEDDTRKHGEGHHRATGEPGGAAGRGRG